MKKNQDANQATTFHDGEPERLLNVIITKLKELSAGDESTKLFPRGLESVELEVSTTQEKTAFRFALKAAAQLTDNITNNQSKADDDEFKPSFNAEGHKVIALIAKKDLEENAPAVLEKIDAILSAGDRTWEEAAIFPDEIRMKQPQTKPFHFVDIPFEEGGPSNPPLPNPPHVLTKLEEYTGLIKSGQGDETEKADNVSWLFHLFGDVHQPLHCIEHISELHPAGDRGGNSFRLRGKPNNLHSAWDSSVNVSETIGDEELAEKIMTLHTREKLAMDLNEKDTEKWARASFALAKKNAYSIEEDADNPPKLSAAYLKNMEKIGRRQAALAGYRLADRLREIFAE